MTAMPSAPPIWRKVFSTPEATPAFATGTEPIAAAAHRSHHERHADAADQRDPGSRSQKSEAVPSREKSTSELPTSVSPPAMSQREPMRSESLPGERGDEDDQQRHRQEDRAGLDGRVAEDLLDVERHEEEDAEHRERDEERDDVRAGERAACGTARGRASARGGVARSSTNSAIPTAAPANRPRIVGDVQP